MVLYIYLLFYNIAIYCAPNAGCIQTSVAHFDYLVGIGAVELIFELMGMIRIYQRKFPGDGKVKGPLDPRMMPKRKRRKGK